MKRVVLCALALVLTLAAVESKPVSACALNFCAMCGQSCATHGELAICNGCSCHCYFDD